MSRRSGPTLQGVCEAFPWRRVFLLLHLFLAVINPKAIVVLAPFVWIFYIVKNVGSTLAPPLQSDLLWHACGE